MLMILQVLLTMITKLFAQVYGCAKCKGFYTQPGHVHKLIIFTWAN